MPDGEGGSVEEFCMLNLRLSEGLTRENCVARFGAAGAAAFELVLQRAQHCPKALVRTEQEKIFFTPEGFLVSNALLAQLLEDF